MKIKITKNPSNFFFINSLLHSVSLSEFLPDSALLCDLNHIYTCFSGSNKSISGPFIFINNRAHMFLTVNIHNFFGFFLKRLNKDIYSKMVILF